MTPCSSARGVAGIVVQLVVFLARNQKVAREILKTHEHRSLKIYIYQLVVCRGANILAFESFLDHRACQSSPWIELH